jgi:UDP-N-acetylmuramate--alanine ligase
MHIFFSGIGGTGIGPLALIAKQAGYDVSGSDAKESQYTTYLRQKGLSDISIGQTRDDIEQVHSRQPIDWFVHSSAVDPDGAEMVFCRENDIKVSKRSELINKILEDKGLKLIAVAGTHGKTTTTAMAVWLFKQLGIPLSYSVGAKINYGEMGQYEQGSEYFVYECDEFDRNFLDFHPYISILSGIGYDHQEIFPSKEDYIKAFDQFVNQSDQVVAWQEDVKLLNKLSNLGDRAEDYNNPAITNIKLPGLVNRRDAWLVIKALAQITQKSPDELIPLMNQFPGVSRRFEKIADNLYSDYAHTPEKITGALNVANEAADPDQKLVVVYEPLTNRRVHFTLVQHKSLFNDVSALYWVPSFMAREDASQPVLSPSEIIESLDDQSKNIAKPMELNGDLAAVIKNHLANGDLVMALSGGGAGSLDEWLREEFKS